ncbi:MAG: flagellar motor switch protein FliN [Rhodocyclaceae bacterium]|nr:flagellar motor switch protein FliN [Rhodocyclaceae bacterium]
MSDEEQITDDDWAAAMQEQAEAEDGDDGMNDADVEAALREAAEGGSDDGEDESPFQAKPASQLFPDFGASAKGSGSLNDFDMIMDIPVQLTVELGRTKLSIRNLLQLAHGSVVELDGLAGEPMDVLVNGTLIAQGEVVVVNDKFGIRLTDIITPAERMRKLRN